MKLTTSSSTGHFAMFQTVIAVSLEAEHSANLLRQTAGER